MILFAGNGCTGAVNTFVRILGIERKQSAYGTSTPVQSSLLLIICLAASLQIPRLPALLQ